VRAGLAIMGKHRQNPAILSFTCESEFYFRPPPRIRALRAAPERRRRDRARRDIGNGAAGIDWARETFRDPVLYLAGNHEYYEGEFEAVQEAMGGRRTSLRSSCSIAAKRPRRRSFSRLHLWTITRSRAGRGSAVIEARESSIRISIDRCGSRAFAPEDGSALRPHRPGSRCARHAFPWKDGRHHHFAPHPRSIAPGMWVIAPTRVRCGSRGNDGERPPVDHDTRTRFSTIARAAPRVICNRAAIGRTDGFKQTDRGDLSFPPCLQPAG